MTYQIKTVPLHRRLVLQELPEILNPLLVEILNSKIKTRL